MRHSLRISPWTTVNFFADHTSVVFDLHQIRGYSTRQQQQMTKTLPFTELLIVFQHVIFLSLCHLAEHSFEGGQQYHMFSRRYFLYDYYSVPRYISPLPNFLTLSLRRAGRREPWDCKYVSLTRSLPFSGGDNYPQSIL